MRAPQPPLEYLVTASQASLEAFELAQLNRSANLRKELRDILDEWLQTEVDARVSRWILECRRAQNDDAGSLPAPPREPVRIGQLALAFLPQANPLGTHSAQIPAQASNEKGKYPPESPMPGVFSPSQDVRPPMTLLMTSPTTPHMTSKDAFASLRLLENFLARPAQSADTANPPSGQPNPAALSDGDDSSIENHAPLHRAGNSARPNHAATARRRRPRSTPRVRNTFLPTVRRAPHRCGQHHPRAVKQSVAARGAWRHPPQSRRQHSPKDSTPVPSASAPLCHSQTRALNILSPA
jgi:hypothetical protein